MTKTIAAYRPTILDGPVFDLGLFSVSRNGIMASKRFVLDEATQGELDACDVIQRDLARGNEPERSIAYLEERGYEVKRK